MADSVPAPPPFAVVPAEVADCGQFVQQTAHALIAGVRSADSEIQGLMSTWTGNAADSYLSGWEEARGAAIEVLEALSTMADLLGVTVENFDSTEVGNTAAVQAAGGSLLNIPTTLTAEGNS